MHVVIAGCGRVGSGLARDIAHEGFDVSVIDEKPDSFYLLGEDFPGEMIVGTALDWDTLRRARLKDAAAFVACTDGDNTNLVVAQIAQKKYAIGCVVARVFDPLRAELFAKQGMSIVCPTRDLRAALFDAVRACRMPNPPQEG
jgi:trk system potassium uptake protein TrkA